MVNSLRFVTVFLLQKSITICTSGAWKTPWPKCLTNGQSILVDTDYQGCWKSQDGLVKIIPVMLVSRHNMGIYQESFNPAGTAKVRTGLASLDFSQCFQQSRIGYFNTEGIECPDYNAATYDYNTDSYTYQDVQYAHSGLSVTQVTTNPLGKFADIIETSEICSYKREMATPAKALFTLEQKMIANQMETELMPVCYGTVRA